MSTLDTVFNAMKQAGKPLMAGEIASICGLNKKEVDKAMAQLKKENKIVSPKVCFWEPK